MCSWRHHPDVIIPHDPASYFTVGLPNVTLHNLLLFCACLTSWRSVFILTLLTDFLFSFLFFLRRTKFQKRELKLYLYFSILLLLTPAELTPRSSSWPGDGHLVKAVISLDNSVVPWVCGETLGRCRLIVWKIGLMSPNQIDHYVLAKLQNSFIWQGPGHIT